MAKKSAIEKNIRRIKIVSLKKTRRENLKSIIRDRSKSIEDRFEASCKLAKEKRDGSLKKSCISKSKKVSDLTLVSSKNHSN